MWHAFIAIGQHTRLDDVWRDMTSSPLDNTYGGTTSGVLYHHYPWTTYTVGVRRAWYAIIALVQHIRSDDIALDRPSMTLDSKHEHVIIALC